LSIVERPVCVTSVTMRHFCMGTQGVASAAAAGCHYLLRVLAAAAPPAAFDAECHTVRSHTQRRGKGCVNWEREGFSGGRSERSATRCAGLVPSQSSQRGALAGSQRCPFAGSQRSALAGSQRCPFAGSQRGALAGSQRCPFAGSQCGALAGSQLGTLARLPVWCPRRLPACRPRWRRVQRPLKHRVHTPALTDTATGKGGADREREGFSGGRWIAHEADTAVACTEGYTRALYNHANRFSSLGGCARVSVRRARRFAPPNSEECPQHSKHLGSSSYGSWSSDKSHRSACCGRHAHRVLHRWRWWWFGGLRRC
jgi:hypothetical protein